MTSAADLFALQEIDLRRDARRAVIADIEARLGETEEIVAAREALANAQAELARLQRRQRDLDGRLEDLDAKIEPIETKLYDGSVRNPKELSDMQREVEAMKKRRGALDDEGLELIEAVEAATSGLAAADTELRRAQAYWEADQAGLIEEKRRAETEAAQLEAERELRMRDMDGRASGLYEGLRSIKQGRAVARIERSTCQGCRLSLPTNVVQQVRGGTVLVQCPSCERILVAG